jgi:predicted RND superfamily exporter protein
MAPPFNLPRETAIERLKGTFIGKPTSASASSGGRLVSPTCLAAFLTHEAAFDEHLRREAIDRLRATIAAEAEVKPAAVHLAGPGMDAVGLEDESLRTLARLGGVVCAVSFGLAAWRLRNLFLAAIIVGAAGISAAASVAIVFYCGVLEVTTMDRAAPSFGLMDGLVVGVPALVYAVALSMAFRLAYFYRDARLEGDAGAAERAVGEGRPWWLITPLLAAAMLGALCVSEVTPLRRFSVFAGLGMIVSVGIVLAILSVLLHRFPLSQQSIAALGNRGLPPRWTEGMYQFGAGSWFAIMLFCVSTLGLAGWGLTSLNTSADLPVMAGGRSRLAKDYAWFGDHIGHASALEMVLSAPIERCRSADESAEADGQQYRLTLTERMELVEHVAARVQAVANVSGVLSAATAMPANRGGDQGGAELSQALERLGLLRSERGQASSGAADRELWRISARLPAAIQARGVNTSRLLRQIREAVGVVIATYDQRDMLVRNLHERGQRLAGAKVCILFHDEFNEAAPRQDSREQLLGKLLDRSGLAADGVKFVNIEALNENGRTARVVRERTLELLHKQTAVVTMMDTEPAVLAHLAADGVNMVNVAVAHHMEESAAAPAVETGGARPIRVMYAGMPPVAAALNAGLLPTLWTASELALLLLAGAMMAIVWDIFGGVLAVLPVVFPMGIVVGAVGWSGVRVDLGLVLPATLAVALALEGTINYVAWFRRGTAAGLFRQEAARVAYARMAPAMFDTFIVAGVGLLPLAMSGIASIQLMGLLAAPIALTAMVATLSLMPGMVCSPLSQFFGAALEPPVSGVLVRPVSLEGVRADRAMSTPSQPHVGTVGGVTRVSSVAAGEKRPQPHADERHDALDAPHLSLHAKLQRLRHSAGESPVS